jgi:predicted transcriptional regulator
MDNVPDRVKRQSELAALLGVTQQRISQQLKEWRIQKDRNGYYDVQKIMSLRAMEISERVQSLLPVKIENGDLEVVKEIMNGLGKFKNMVESYQTNRGEIFAGEQAKLLEVAERILISFKDTEIEKMSAKDRIRALKDIFSSVTILFEKERLENDLSTANVSIIVQQIKDLKRREREKQTVEPQKQSNPVVEAG